MPRADSLYGSTQKVGRLYLCESGLWSAKHSSVTAAPDWGGPMNTLREAVEEYVTIRRGPGTELRLPAAALHHFVDFVGLERSDFVTISS